MRLVSYARTSGAGSGEESLSSQCERGAAWAALHGHEIVGEFRDESVTGTIPIAQRPALRAAVELIKSGDAAGLLVPDLGRLARELWEQEAALATIWRLDAVVLETGRGEVQQNDPDDPVRKLLRLMMGAVWGFDRDIQVKRMRVGRERKAARGGYIGGFRPYGYRVVDREFVPEPVEQAVIATIIALRRGSPPMAYKEIAACLNADECPSPSGGVWGAQTVLNIYQREGRTAA